MKTIKAIGIVVLILIVLLLIISFFLPANMTLEKSKVLKASPAAVYSQINNLKNWKNWSPWSKIDSTMKITYEGPEEGKGAKYSWSSDNKSVGNGSMWITESVPNQMVSTEMDFRDRGTGKSNFTLEPADSGGTKVTWTMESNAGNNPILKFGGMIMKKMVGKMFEKGLANLDAASLKAQQDMMVKQTMQSSSDTTSAKKDTVSNTVSKM